MYVDFQNTNKIYGGAQDNNTQRTQTGSSTDWQAIYGGDGFQPLVDPTNTNVIYAEYQRGNFAKSTNNGSSFTIAMTGISPSDRKNWDTPVTFDPNNSQTLYYGANRVYKTTNAAGNWSAISPDLTNGPYTGNLTYGTITSIDVSPFNSSIIYAGTDDGNVWVTQNGGANWTHISASLPNRWVTKVLASGEDENTVYVTFSGYRYGEGLGHVFKSTNNGTNWTDISGNTPDIPINDILQDGFGNLFLGTDIGVLASNDEGVNWQPLGENMPSVVVTDMFIHQPSEYLYVATFGRSIYKIDLANDVLNTSENETLNQIKLFPNPASEKVTILIPEGLNSGNITIFDTLGRSVFQKNFTTSESINIPLNGIEKGTYFVTISSEKGKISKKLLVR